MTDEVFVLGQTRAQQLEPVRSDHREHVLASRQRLLDGLKEVLSRLDVVDVDEHAVVSEARDQPIRQTPGVAARIFRALAV